MPSAPPPVDRLRHAYQQWHETKGASSDLFLDLLADEIVMRTVLNPAEPHPMAQERIGIEHARDYLDSLVLNLEMLEFPTEEIVAQGDTVVWIGSCHWRDPRSGREARTAKADIWRFRDGKAVSVMEMFDTLGFARLNQLV
ncbi:MAG: nuclear transport factor 2 family protein [Sphingomonas sp.]